jgi:hypothetical protein
MFLKILLMNSVIVSIMSTKILSKNVNSMNVLLPEKTLLDSNKVVLNSDVIYISQLWTENVKSVKDLGLKKMLWISLLNGIPLSILLISDITLMLTELLLNSLTSLKVVPLLKVKVLTHVIIGLVS